MRVLRDHLPPAGRPLSRLRKATGGGGRDLSTLRGAAHGPGNRDRSPEQRTGAVLAGGRPRSTAPAIKADAEQASRQRLDALWEIDRRRLRAEAEAEARRRVQDRRTLTWAAVASGVIALFFLVLVAAALLR